MCAATASLLLLLAPSRSLPAQGTAPIRSNVLAVNPLGIPFKFLSVDYERALAGGFSLGGNVSYISWGDEDDSDEVSYRSVELKGRIYPEADGLRGFAVGLTAGVSQLKEDITDDTGLNDDLEDTFPTLGVVVDYNWLLGKERRFFVGMGLGAKRVYGDDEGFSEANFAYMTARFQVGVAF